jgi:hypothetical protein
MKVLQYDSETIRSQGQYINTTNRKSSQKGVLYITKSQGAPLDMQLPIIKGKPTTEAVTVLNNK